MKRILQTLKETDYLQGRYLNENRVADVNLLKNGEIFKNQLLNHWKGLVSNNNQCDIREIKASTTGNGRLAFMQSKNFKKNYQKLLDSTNFRLGSIIQKSILTEPAIEENECLFQQKCSHTVQLISDKYLPAFQGLENFYSIQRERKIWWMRFSADPSRYLVEPYDMSKELEDGHFSKDSQSVTIKSNLFDNTVDMETITLVRLNGFMQKESSTAIALIRSVIDMGLTTCALLFDAGSYNDRPILRLNKKLAPYQCGIATLCTDVRSGDIDDLCLHLKYVLKGAGLRLHEQPFHAKSNNEIELLLTKSDCLGIPYTIIVENDSLKTGLLKLRNRDTSLAETIHISDLPLYLIKICK
uniref:Anticodon-binding domain-containing protein n=1 Tax=Stomoxys calcitrans TaxID=35570 RepID=A0A1I8PJ25_STOCA